MADALEPRLRDLVLAHRILVEQDVLDAFGHVSIRDPRDPAVFWLARALPPSLVEVSDFVAFGPDGEAVVETAGPVFAERFIHAEIYKARPDVQAICHHHAAAILPFCIGGAPLVPISQTGAFMGGPVPVWDSAHEFGDTAMLVDDLAQAASLARGLGNSPLVLMRGHGATVVGTGLKDLVFKCVYSCREADAQRAASAWGSVKGLASGEILKTGQPRPSIAERCWQHWTATIPRNPND